MLLLIDNNITSTERVETSEKKATQTIRQTFEDLHKALDDRMNELLRELHTTAVARTTALGLQREGYEVLKQNIGHYSDTHAGIQLLRLPVSQLLHAVTYLGCSRPWHLLYVNTRGVHLLDNLRVKYIPILLC